MGGKRRNLMQRHVMIETQYSKALAGADRLIQFCAGKKYQPLHNCHDDTRKCYALFV